MEINRDNYEEFFLDFAEGNLSAEQEETLNNFLKFNPDLEDELKTFDLMRVTPREIKMPFKESLKKEIPSDTDTISSQNFDMYSIAYLENDLTEYQQSLFDEFLKSDEEYQESFRLMKSTYLQAEFVPFPHKSRLKKRSLAVINLRILLPFAAAAALALLLLVRTDIFTIEPEIASVPETERTYEPTEIEPIVAKPPVKEKAASIQIIRNSRSQVPVSNLKYSPALIKTKPMTTEKIAPETSRIAGVNLSRIHMPAMDVKEDRIVLETQDLPSINMSSLALADRVRYQLNRASDLMDEDDVFIWNLASQGIDQISKRTGADMSLMASQNQDGAVSGFRFKSRFLNVTAPIAQDQ